MSMQYTKGPLQDGRADWRPRDVESGNGWSHVLTGREVDVLDSALAALKAAGTPLDGISSETFPLPGLEPLFDNILAELEAGRGLFLLRGLPVERYSKDDMRAMYVGLCRNIGTTLSQSPGNDHIGDVRNLNVDVNSPRGRAYTSNQKLTFHSDQSDVVTLLVLRTAKSGGLSKLASALAIRNEIARTRPDLLEVLHQPFPWSWQEQQPPGEGPWYSQPIYTERDGKFSSYYIRTHITSSQRYEDAPRLTPQQVEAMDAIDALAASEEFHFSSMFQPGDMQLLNNHVILHSRTAFEDHEELDRRRHLLRVWLSVPNSRALSPAMNPLFRDQSPGAVRGGYTPRVPQRQYETTESMT
jgi:hypothetical protein